MIETKMIVDKRKYKRYAALKGTYVELINATSRIGQIINFSRGGLAFSYISNMDPLPGQLIITVFSRQHFFLVDVPFSVITDFHLDAVYSFSTISMRRCGGKFGKLTPLQISQLDILISTRRAVRTEAVSEW